MRHSYSALLLAVFFTAQAFGADGPITYPETNRIDHVDEYHGTKVPDPYRWLEDDVRQSDDVRDWVTRQNKVTFAYLESLPEREEIKERLTELWNYEKVSTPFKSRDQYFFLKNDGLQNQSVLYVQDSLEGEARVLIDPNKWSADGTIALTGTALSDDGRFLAYGVADAGSDWQGYRVLDVASGVTMPDEVRWMKYSGVTWTPDSKGFFYGRFAEPKEGEAFQSLTFNQKLYYHRVGTPQGDDVLVYERPDHPEWGFGADVTDDGRYLIISIWIGTDDRNRVVYKDLSEPYGMPLDLVDNFDHEYTFIDSDGSLLYFKTSMNSPNRRVIGVDLHYPQPEHFREIIPESTNALQGVDLVGNLFIASYLEDAKTAVRVFQKDGTTLRDAEFPGIGSAEGFRGKSSDTETFYTFSSFAVPPSVYRYDVVTGESRLLKRAEVDFDPAEYETKQVFYMSKDGTRVPMFITHKKSTVLDGKNPTLLYGYGGFNISETPAFSTSRLLWMERGGVFAVANLRGGGEYGEAWHKAGIKQKKQNVFDDFIAAAEYLIDHRYCSPDTLAIQGGSNGGLLVGAVMTQRPELFGVALPAVGVMDMLRFHQFTAGRFWTDDYGSADNADEFPALFAYSPYHNLREGVNYPPTLVTTADTDDRVVPGHSFKFAAALQRAQADPNAPALIRIETRAGHGAGKPTSKRIEEIADQYAFAWHHLKGD